MWLGVVIDSETTQPHKSMIMMKFETKFEIKNYRIMMVDKSPHDDFEFDILSRRRFWHWDSPVFEIMELPSVTSQFELIWLNVYEKLLENMDVPHMEERVWTEDSYVMFDTGIKLFTDYKLVWVDDTSNDEEKAYFDVRYEADMDVPHMLYEEVISDGAYLAVVTESMSGILRNIIMNKIHHYDND